MISQLRNEKKSTNLLPETVVLLSDLFSDSSLDGTVVEAPEAPVVVAGTSKIMSTVTRKKTKTENVCHLAGYVPTKSEKQGPIKKNRTHTRSPIIWFGRLRMTTFSKDLRMLL
jgi:hypothetical protein